MYRGCLTHDAYTRTLTHQDLNSRDSGSTIVTTPAGPSNTLARQGIGRAGWGRHNGAPGIARVKVLVSQGPSIGVMSQATSVHWTRRLFFGDCYSAQSGLAFSSMVENSGLLSHCSAAWP